MKKILLIIFSLFSLLSILLNLLFLRYFLYQNTVSEVVDGDTFQLKSGKRVRLMGVDAPEIDRCAGSEAKIRLSELILGKRVSLKEEAQEAFGRSLALVYADNVFVNKIMLEEGWGRTDYRKNTKRDILTDAFHKAQEAKVGIYSDLCREVGDVSGDCLIKGNIDKNTYEKYYHLPDCSHYNQVVIEKDIGEGYFCSESEAVNAGFTKASGCP